MKVFKLKKTKRYKSTVLGASAALFAAHVLSNSKKVIKKVKIHADIELCISNFQRLYSIQFSPWCLPLIYLAALCKSLPFLSHALMTPSTKHSRSGHSLWPVPRKKYFPPVLTLLQRVSSNIQTHFVYFSSVTLVLLKELDFFFYFFFCLSTVGKFWRGNSVCKHRYKITILFYTCSL